MTKNKPHNTPDKIIKSSGRDREVEEEERVRIIKETMVKMITSPGQGSLLEQLDKIVRREQRKRLFEMIEQLNDEEIKHSPVTLEKIIPQSGKQGPLLLRFHIHNWRGYDEVFWRSLCDYIIVALHRVKDVDYDSTRGKIKVEYFPKTEGRVRTPATMTAIIQRIAYMVDKEILRTDFTRFRRMDERSDKIGELSKAQAAALSAGLSVALRLI